MAGTSLSVASVPAAAVVPSWGGSDRSLAVGLGAACPAEVTTAAATGSRARRARVY